MRPNQRGGQSQKWLSNSNLSYYRFALKADAMADEIKSQDHRVDRAHNGKFHAFWRGQVVYANGRVKRFESEQEAWEFLARCDTLGKIEH